MRGILKKLDVLVFRENDVGREIFFFKLFLRIRKRLVFYLIKEEVLLFLNGIIYDKFNGER